jgi:hypothetical protein
MEVGLRGLGTRAEQCKYKYNVIFRRVQETIVAVEKQ